MAEKHDHKDLEARLAELEDLLKEYIERARYKRNHEELVKRK